MKEIKFEDKVVIKQIKNNILKLAYEEVPLVIHWVGRKQYVLNSTQNGGLILSKKEI